MFSSLLLLLPTVVLSEITIDIFSDSKIKMTSEELNNINKTELHQVFKGTGPKVQFYGFDSSIITDADRNIFQINDHQLKDACRIYHGARPDYCYVKNPTPGDLYTSYNWNEVRRNLSVKSAKVLSVNSETTVIASKNFKNDETTPVTIPLQVLQSRGNKVIHSWSRLGNVTSNISIDYNINVGVNGRTKFSSSNMFLEPLTNEVNADVGSESSTNITVQAGQTVVAVLTASKGSMKVEIEYEETLTGTVVAQYKSLYKDHYFWALGVSDVMNAGNIPLPVMWTEIVTIKFYADENITVYDLNGNQIQ